eukprot:403363581
MSSHLKFFDDPQSSISTDISTSSSDPDYYQIFLKGFQGRSLTFGSFYQFTKESTVLQLKAAVSERTGIPEDELTLIFVSKQLDENYDTLKFEDLGIYNHSSMVLVQRLSGGAKLQLKIKLLDGEILRLLNVDKDSTVLKLKDQISKQQNLLDSSQMCLKYENITLRNDLTLAEHALKSGSLIIQTKQDLSLIPDLKISYEPDIISLDDSLEVRAKMPCGHVISTESMTNYLKSLVKKKKNIIKCPGYKSNKKLCDVEWEYNLCQKIGVLTIEERKEIELGFEMNLFYQQKEGIQCPICNSFVKKDKSALTSRVRCKACYSRPGSYDFCLNCYQRWNPNSKSKNDCGNIICGNKDERNIFLLTCRVRTIFGNPEIPTTRLCPNCTTMIHLKKGCQHMSCKTPKSPRQQIK